VEAVLKRYKLIEQLIESRKNAVLVVPQGPYDASDSFGGKLEDPDGFKRFMGDVQDVLRREARFPQDFKVGRIILFRPQRRLPGNFRDRGSRRHVDKVK